jgi:hypothetical protein
MPVIGSAASAPDRTRRAARSPTASQRSPSARARGREQSEEASHRAVALDQLRAPLGVVIAVAIVRSQLVELLKRDRQLTARDRPLNPSPRLRQRGRLGAPVLRHLQQHAERPGYLRGSPAQRGQRPQLRLVALPLGPRAASSPSTDRTGPLRRRPSRSPAGGSSPAASPYCRRVLADAVRAAIRSASPNRLRSSRSGTGDGVSEEGITAAAGTESSTRSPSMRALHRVDPLRPRLQLAHRSDLCVNLASRVS